MRKTVLGFMILAVIFSASSVWALQLFPTSTKLEVRRGETVKCLLSVNNSDSNPVNCKVYVSGFEVVKDGKQRFEDANEKYSATKWLSIKESQIEIPSKSKKEIEVEIVVPRNTEPGDYFASVFAETSSPDSIKNQQGVGVSISVHFKLGSFICITVPGQTIPKKAEISDVQVEVPVLGKKEKDIKISATLQNKCRLRLDAQGEVLIKNSVTNRVFDRFILQGDGKPAKGDALVYPMGERNFTGMMRRPLPAGEYIAEVSFSYGSRVGVKASTKFVVSEELRKEQKALLTLIAEPSLVKAEMLPGAFRVLSLKVSNLDLESMKVKAVSLVAWIEVEPIDFEIRSNRPKNLRVKVSVPIDEQQTTMIGKILLQPERGKPITIDIVVSLIRKGEQK